MAAEEGTSLLAPSESQLVKTSLDSVIQSKRSVCIRIRLYTLSIRNLAKYDGYKLDVISDLLLLLLLIAAYKY
jgi:hypothetical protein